jgi:lipid-binding SYLF domain-containing protein
MASAFMPTIGAKMSVSNPRVIRNLSFETDVSVSKIYATADFHAPNTYYEINSIFTSLSMGFKYNFGNARISPFIDGGFVLAGSFNRSINYKREQQEDWKSLPKVKSLRADIGAYAGTGLEYELKNKHSVFISANAILLNTIRLYQLKLGYTF